jgi:hypothetical protein
MTVAQPVGYALSHLDRCVVHASLTSGSAVPARPTDQPA